MAAGKNLAQRLEAERFESNPLSLKNAWPIIKEKTAVQTGPVDGQEKHTRKACSYRNTVRGSHRSAKEKAPWHCQGALIRSGDQKSLQELGRYFGLIGFVAPTPHCQPTVPVLVLPKPLRIKGLLAAAPKPGSDEVVTIMSPWVAETPE